MASLDPDAVLSNGVVRTLRDSGDRTEAVAVSGGRIVAVGAQEQVSELAGRRTARLDLKGAALLPGFIDSHVHIENGERYDRTLDGSSTLDELLARLSRLVAGRTDEEALVFYGNVPDPTAWPSRADLDRIAPERPLFVGLGQHVFVANTVGLDRSGLTRDPAVVERDERDGPTGLIRGRTAYEAIRMLVYDEAYVNWSVRRGLAELARVGVTTTHHIVQDRLPALVYQQLREAGDLPLRVGLLIRGYEAETRLESVLNLGLMQGFGDEWLAIQGVKVSVDGYFPGGGSAFCEPYEDEPDNRGFTRITQDDLNTFLDQANELGIRCCVHTNGDRAVDMALTAFEGALARVPRRDHRHRLEHVGNLYLRDDQIERIRRLGLVAVPNPTVLHERVGHVARRLGRKRGAHPVNVKDLLAAGVPVAAASDFPGLYPVDPLLGIEALTTRRSRLGHVYAPDQAITVREAFQLYTSAAAWVGFEEERKGTIAAGKLADFVVLAEDPLSVPPHRIGSIEVLATIVGGKVAYASDDGPLAGMTDLADA